MIGRLPNLRYIGTNKRDPNPYARLEYETSPEALVGVIPNSTE